MSTEAAAVATSAPATEGPATPEEGKAPESAETGDDGLNPLQRIAKDARARKEAKLAAAGKPKEGGGRPAESPKDEPPPAAARGGAPERGPDGKFLSSDGKAKAESGGDSARVEAAKEEAREAGIKPPEQRANESVAQYEIKIARLLADQKRKDAELLELKGGHEKSTRRLTEIEKLIERVKGDTIDEEALEALTGRDFERLVLAVRDGKEAGGADFKPKVRLPPELAAVRSEMAQEIAALRAEREAIAAAKKAQEDAVRQAEEQKSKAETFKREVSFVSERIKEWEEDFPRLAAMPDAAERLLKNWYGVWAGSKNDPNKMPDLRELAQNVETALSSQVGTMLSSERALKAALQDPKTREMAVRVLKALETNATDSQPQTRNQGQPETAPAEGPPTLSNKVSQEAPVPAEKVELSEEEERAAFHARMRAANKAREEALKARFSRG